MTRKMKHKKSKEAEKEFYVFDVNDWEVLYNFQVNTSQKILSGNYWENTELILEGNLVSPTLKNTSQIKISITGDPQIDGHWEQPTIDTKSLTIGWLQSGVDDVFTIHCSVPFRALPFIAEAVASGKVKQVSVWGTKLKWRSGWTYGISLATHPEE